MASSFCIASCLCSDVHNLATIECSATCWQITKNNFKLLLKDENDGEEGLRRDLKEKEEEQKQRKNKKDHRQLAKQFP
ncbi:hypothetical protein NC653_005345 [Populus alba x Populus x berolinensis]|uniref:Uncharacterized protein n=1 Tax=Populus alba x Populus x berolinensis TaxID=444605 RepID=A0AAD6RBR1_9ROSI|nr:hypothetical protein NC653_005345 [Populus alba x Populus x berolinensis]